MADRSFEYHPSHKIEPDGVLRHCLYCGATVTAHGEQLRKPCEAANHFGEADLVPAQVRQDLRALPASEDLSVAKLERAADTLLPKLYDTLIPLLVPLPHDEGRAGEN